MAPAPLLTNSMEHGMSKKITRQELVRRLLHEDPNQETEVIERSITRRGDGLMKTRFKKTSDTEGGRSG